jgi:hypothetical protein
VTTREASKTIWLYQLLHKSLPSEGVRFQKYQRENYEFDGFIYPYRDWEAPSSIDGSTQGANRAHMLRARRQTTRSGRGFPITDLARNYAGLGGAVLRCLRINTTRNTVDLQVYQVRSAMLIDADVVFLLQASAFDAKWPTIGAMTPTYQRL